MIEKRFKGGKNVKNLMAILLAGFLLGFFTIASMKFQEESIKEPDVTTQEVSPFTYCCISHKGPFTEIEQIIGQVISAMQSQNVMPGGPMIGVYHNSPEQVKPEDLEWEIGFPITPQAFVQSPLEKKQWEFTLVATTIHTGPYEETGESYGRIFEWMEANQYAQTGPVLERYLVTPTPDTKPEDLRAEIWVPCTKKTP